MWDQFKYQKLLKLRILPFVSLLHFERHRREAVTDLADEPHHAFAGQGRGLAGLWKICIKFKKFPEIRIGLQGRVSGCPVDVALQSSATSLDKLEWIEFLFIKLFCNIALKFKIFNNTFLKKLIKVCCSIKFWKILTPAKFFFSFYRSLVCGF
jgi:hypothetical protein